MFCRCQNRSKAREQSRFIITGQRTASPGAARRIGSFFATILFIQRFGIAKECRGRLRRKLSKIGNNGAGIVDARTDHALRIFPERRLTRPALVNRQKIGIG